jgi:hypothetical protein
MLEIPETTMDRLEVVEGGSAAEVGLVEKCDRKTPLGGVPSRGRAIDSRPDHHEVELLVWQRR